MGGYHRFPFTPLPLKRPFKWRVHALLVSLYFLGNLAGIPLLRRTNMPVEPVRLWFFVTIIAILVIGVALVMANRTGLGAPLLEGVLSKTDRPLWLRTGMALTVLMLFVGVPFGLLANRNIDPANFPFGWELLPASIKAGLVEEIGYRLFVVSTFAYLGGLIRKDSEGRPTRGVYWMAIVLAGLIFGWAHVDARLAVPGVSFWALAFIMVLTSALGIYFGWLFWVLGLEWAVLAHFIFDAFISLVIIPVYLYAHPAVLTGLMAGLVFAGFKSWRYLARLKPEVGQEKAG